jgi:hypothetical protein
VLTEDAWEVLLAERDVEALAFLVALVCMRGHEIHQSHVRRAFLENAELRRYAIAIGRDEREMREIGDLVEQARTPEA